jgi:predicted ABC-type ATPase
LNRPSLTVIAGPNGSGKSTLTDYLISQGTDFGRYINADRIAKAQNLTDDSGARIAQKLAETMREQSLSERIDFSFETVMSHESKVEFMTRARDEGYHVTLFFVATSDPAINVQRVKNRVILGGHDVPEDRIVARYHRALALLPAAINECDQTVVFDNSAMGGSRLALRPFFEIKRDRNNSFTSTVYPPVPKWGENLESHLRLES